MWSRHLYLGADDVGCTKVELSFGQPNWADIAPLDTGAQRVVRDGCRVLYDPKERLSQLVRFVSNQS